MTLLGACPAATRTSSIDGPLGLSAASRRWPGTYQSVVHSHTLPTMS